MTESISKTSPCGNYEAIKKGDVVDLFDKRKNLHFTLESINMRPSPDIRVLEFIKSPITGETLLIHQSEPCKITVANMDGDILNEIELSSDFVDDVQVVNGGKQLVISGVHWQPVYVMYLAELRRLIVEDEYKPVEIWRDDDPPPEITETHFVYDDRQKFEWDTITEKIEYHKQEKGYGEYLVKNRDEIEILNVGEVVATLPRFPLAEDPHRFIIEFAKEHFFLPISSTQLGIYSIKDQLMHQGVKLPSEIQWISLHDKYLKVVCENNFTKLFLIDELLEIPTTEGKEIVVGTLGTYINDEYKYYCVNQTHYNWDQVYQIGNFVQHQQEITTSLFHQGKTYFSFLLKELKVLKSNDRLQLRFGEEGVKLIQPSTII